MKVLIDTNVFLDVVLQREKFFKSSGGVLDKVNNFEIEGIIPAQAIPTIYYIVTKYYSHSLAVQFLKDVTFTCQVASLSDKIIQSAFNLELKDFEDALVNETAICHRCRYIITNNVKDFVGSPIKAISPFQFLRIDIR